MTLLGLSFDLDGTLADTLPVCIQAFQSTFSRYAGLELGAAEVVAMFGPSEEGIIENVVGANADEAVEFFMREYEAAHVRCPVPFDGVRQVLDLAAARRVPLALSTGKGARSTAISLRVLGLEGVFDPIGVGSSAGVVKRDAIETAAKRWGVETDAIAHVGDSPYDVRAAREAGAVAVGAAWAPNADGDALREADRCFADVATFGAWLEAALER